MKDITVHKVKNDYLDRMTIIQDMLKLQRFNSVEKFILSVLSYKEYSTLGILIDNIDIFRINNQFNYHKLIQDMKSNDFDDPYVLLDMSDEDFIKFFEIYETHTNNAFDVLSYRSSNKINRDLESLTHQKILNIQRIIDNILIPIADYYERYKKFKIPLKFTIKDRFTDTSELVKYTELDSIFDDGNFILFKCNVIESSELMSDLEKGVFHVNYSIVYMDPISRYILVGNPGIKGVPIKNIIL